MSQSLQTILNDFIKEKDKSVVKKKRTFESHITDLLKDYPAERTISVYLSQIDALYKIASPTTKNLGEGEIARYADELVQRFAVDKTKAKEMVRMWAIALGVQVPNQTTQTPPPNPTPKKQSSSFQTQQTATNNKSSKPKGFWAKLIQGDFGLAKTFWLYHIVANIIFGSIYSYLTHNGKAGIAFILFLVYAIYAIIVLIGVWRAAKKYRGKKLWAILTRIYVILNVLGFIIPIVVPKLMSTSSNAEKTMNAIMKKQKQQEAEVKAIMQNQTVKKKDVVVDNVTHLMWQDNKDAKTVQKTWSGAKEYCEDLTLGGYDDWRLPNYNELLSIVDYTKYNPAIKSGFKNVASDDYWSSSQDVSDSSIAWGVNFDGGGTYDYDESGKGYVRCVRGRQ